jgi:hypothetical protein
MTREIIVQIMEAEGAKAGNTGFVIREDREATCFISAPGDLLPVSKIVRVELKDKFIALQTSKDERFLFAYEDVLGFKLTAASTARGSGAGFGR